MRLNLPYRWRVRLYLLTALGTPLVSYGAGKGWIGPLELQLWGSEVAVAVTVAGLNARRRSGNQSSSTDGTA